eukprot:8152010-Karenia_brevis.AAC.1
MPPHYNWITEDAPPSISCHGLISWNDCIEAAVLVDATLVGEASAGRGLRIHEEINERLDVMFCFFQ